MPSWHAYSYKRAALRFTEESHRLDVSDQSVEELQRLLGPAETIEIVLLAAFYQTVARLIQSFGLEVEAEHQQYLANWSRETA